jgi:hypothetical protein
MTKLFTSSDLEFTNTGRFGLFVIFDPLDQTYPPRLVWNAPSFCNMTAGPHAFDVPGAIAVVIGGIEIMRMLRGLAGTSSVESLVSALSIKTGNTRDAVRRVLLAIGAREGDWTAPSGLFILSSLVLGGRASMARSGYLHAFDDTIHDEKVIKLNDGKESIGVSVAAGKLSLPF